MSHGVTFRRRLYCASKWKEVVGAAFGTVGAPIFRGITGVILEGTQPEAIRAI